MAWNDFRGNVDEHAFARVAKGFDILEDGEPVVCAEVCQLAIKESLSW
jgi:hypothetical protein